MVRLLGESEVALGHRRDSRLGLKFWKVAKQGFAVVGRLRVQFVVRGGPRVAFRALA